MSIIIYISMYIPRLVCDRFGMLVSRHGSSGWHHALCASQCPLHVPMYTMCCVVDRFTGRRELTGRRWPQPHDTQKIGPPGVRPMVGRSRGHALPMVALWRCAWVWRVSARSSPVRVTSPTRACDSPSHRCPGARGSRRPAPCADCHAACCCAWGAAWAAPSGATWSPAETGTARGARPSVRLVGCCGGRGSRGCHPRGTPSPSPATTRGHPATPPGP
mmetsp:Transcript_5808/g.14920  ORF Transcript_5808/g.14920 Transcript_5808/m.14920 type:complete len:218 (-) Transcript_5808:537-1190(-)